MPGYILQRFYEQQSTRFYPVLKKMDFCIDDGTAQWPISGCIQRPRSRKPSEQLSAEGFLS